MSLIAYKYRIYPSKEQKILLEKHFGCSRFVFNQALKEKSERYKTKKESISINKLILKLKDTKRTQEFEWLKEVNSQTLQSSLRNLDVAFQRFFKKKSRYPKFKKKSSKQSAIFPQQNKVDFENGKFYCMKFREGISAKFHEIFEGKIKTCTISKAKSEKYYVSILVEDGEIFPNESKVELDKILGIDVGLKDFAVLSNGHKIKNPKFLKKKLKKLRRFQRNLSKSRKGSANRNKKRIKLAKQHEKVSNSRNDFLHKISKKIVDNQDYSSFAVESLDIKKMLKNKFLSRQISDSGWGIFFQYIKYKAERVGKNFLKIDQFEPSSKTCSNCGNVFRELTLDIRIWKCDCCGTNHDRDVNAARNIRNFAFRSINVLREPQKLTPVEEQTSIFRNSSEYSEDKSVPMNQEAPSFKAG